MNVSGDDPESTPVLERLHKVLAAAGIASRRECETLITEGRVEVDGQVVTEVGLKVDAESQDIRLDGEKVRIGRRQYFAFFKPVGVLCTSADPEGRLSVVDLIPASTRIFTVGRLDKSSEGLIVVTNDGPLAQRLTHPKFGIEKTYDVVVAGLPTWEQVRVLLDGVRLAEGWAKVRSIEIRRRVKGTTQLRIVLDEGRNREIRRLLAGIGHKVLRLRRIAIGKLTLGTLKPGESRRLTAEEIEQLEQPSGFVKKSKRAARPEGGDEGKRGAESAARRPARPGPARERGTSAERPGRPRSTDRPSRP
ncbi:MAG TPA: pseudouridine synthase, partial [Pirellulaceae bacterium]|nr:pseudouridine synthase [Pirellulaceae bacterium]